MTYPGTPVQRPRPGVVNMAAYILIALAVIQLISVAVQVSTIGATLDAVRDYASEVEDTAAGNTFATTLQITTYVAVAFGILYGLAFLVLGMLIRRGSNGARITTWILAGLSLCCGVAGIAGTAAGGLMQTDDSGAAFDSAEVSRRIEEAVPGWYTPVTLVLAVLALLLALAVIILLALPASNDFFRKPAATGWEPPGGYPPAGGDPGFGGPAFGGPPSAGPAFGGPAFGGPPSAGPPSAGPPSAGPPSAGPPYGGPAPGDPGRPDPGYPPPPR